MTQSLQAQHALKVVTKALAKRDELDASITRARAALSAFDSYPSSDADVLDALVECLHRSHTLLGAKDNA